jgi:hypothetical protein
METLEINYKFFDFREYDKDFKDEYTFKNICNRIKEMVLNKNKVGIKIISTHFCDTTNEKEIKEIFTCLSKCYNLENNCNCNCKEPKERGIKREEKYKYIYNPKFDYENFKLFGIDNTLNIFSTNTIALNKISKEKYTDLIFKFN